MDKEKINMHKYSIGIDLGGTKILTAIVNKTTGEVVSSIKKKTKKDKGQDKIIQKIIKSVHEVLSQNKYVSEYHTLNLNNGCTIAYLIIDNK